uniref:Uncharacterized protein n=1 Tax=Rhizophora mucronata TaxID=61149 RepID=A0A2P2PRW9_RHIMU
MCLISHEIALGVINICPCPIKQQPQNPLATLSTSVWMPIALTILIAVSNSVPDSTTTRTALN